MYSCKMCGYKYKRKLNICPICGTKKDNKTLFISLLMIALIVSGFVFESLNEINDEVFVVLPEKMAQEVAQQVESEEVKVVLNDEEIREIIEYLKELTLFNQNEIEKFDEIKDANPIWIVKSSYPIGENEVSLLEIENYAKTIINPEIRLNENYDYGQDEELLWNEETKAVSILQMDLSKYPYFNIKSSYFEDEYIKIEAQYFYSVEASVGLLEEEVKQLYNQGVVYGEISDNIAEIYDNASEVKVSVYTFEKHEEGYYLISKSNV